MSNYATLKAAISTAIKQNGNEEITGQVLQTTLLSMVDSLVSGYLFKGIATPSTVVGTPDENVFWIAPAGSYSNFGATPIDVPTGCIGIFQYNGSFTNTVVYVGGTVDISALSHTAYASLSQALGDLPAALHIGGIEVRYQDSTTSKFVKYRLMATSWSTMVSDWEEYNNVSVSQNIETGHTDISVGGVTTPVASVEEVNDIDEELNGKYTEFDAKEGTSTGTDRYLVTWEDIHKSAGDKIYLRTNGVRPANLTIYEYTTGNSTLLPVTEIDESHGYIQTLEGAPFTGINFIGITSGQNVYVTTGTKQGGIVPLVESLNEEVFGGPQILEIEGDGTQKFVSWESLNKVAGDLIEFETDGVAPSSLNIYEYTTGNATLLTVTEITTTKGSIQTLEGGAYTGINFTNLAIGKKVRFVVGRNEGLRELINSRSDYYGKNAITLGDSHSQNRAKWLPYVCAKLGMNYLSELNAQLNVGNTVPSAYEVAENPLLAQVRALKDNIGDNSVDVIFLEDVHYVFKNYNNTDETISAYPFKPTQLISLRTYNGTRAEEQADFEQNYATLLSGISQASRRKKTLMKSICNGVTRKLTFSADTISDGLLTITIDGQSFSTQVSSTMSLARVVLEVSSWQFGDTTDWRNVDRGTDYITFLYEGSGDASINFSYNSGGTGITLSMGSTESYSDATYRYFASTDLDNWEDITYWQTFRNFWYNGFSKWKGVIEELQSFLPNAEIVILALTDYRLNSADEDFDMDALTQNAEYIRGKKTRDSLKEVANLYSCKFLDIWQTCGISPFNWFTFYPADTVHPNDDGYLRWAKTIVKELN